jgi:hypothetical protein
MPNFELKATIYLNADSETDALNIIEYMLLDDPFISDFKIGKIYPDPGVASTLNYDEDEESTVLNTGYTGPEPEED